MKEKEINHLNLELNLEKALIAEIKKMCGVRYPQVIKYVPDENEKTITADIKLNSKETIQFSFQLKNLSNINIKTNDVELIITEEVKKYLKPNKTSRITILFGNGLCINFSKNEFF